MSNEGKSKAKDIAPIVDIGRDVLLRDLDEFSQYMLQGGYQQTYPSILVHMKLTMQKMNRFDATAILMSYIFAAKDLLDESFSNINGCLAAYFKIDIKIFNQTEREFLKCDEIDYSISHLNNENHELKKLYKEMNVIVKEKINKAASSSISDLQNAIKEYETYISAKNGKEWDSRKKMLSDFKAILCDSTKEPQRRLADFYKFVTKSKPTLMNNPDPRTNSFMRQVTYILATCITLGIFNVARMAYRACSGNAYVSFSRKFSGEKFVEHVENIGTKRLTATH